MKRLILAALMAGMFTTVPAMAKNNGGCQGNCAGDTIHNDTTNHYGGQGGAGIGVGVGIGQGGAGGQGGSVAGSGNSHNANANINANRNANTNRNTNKQGQQQGQLQGQQQAAIATQSQSSRNDNRSSASNEGNNSSQSVTVQGDNYEAPRIPVATAYAPNIAPTAVCMGSSSAGGQGMTFGVSIGTSWTDENCLLLEQVRTVSVVLNDRATASEMMCEVKAYAEARKRTGNPCAGEAPKVVYIPQHTPVAQTIPAPQIASAQPIVTPVPPRVERYTITAAGLQRIN